MTEETQAKVVAAYQIASQGDFDHARMILEEALYDDSSNIDAWLLLADLAVDREEALQCYQMVLESNPDHRITQQRMKLLLGSTAASKPAEEETFGLSGVDNGENLFPDVDSFLEEEADFSVSGKPTLKESFNAHRKLVIGFGAGLVALLGLLALAWAGSVIFMAWRMGYLLVGG